MRNDSDGTVLRAVSEAGETKCHSGKVRWPAERACTWTVASVVSKGGEGGAVCLTKIEDISPPRIESNLRTRIQEMKKKNIKEARLLHTISLFRKVLGIMSPRV